jgi:hypothetical protein
MTKENSSTQSCQDESSVDVPDASHSHVSNDNFGNLPKYVTEDGSRRNMSKAKSGPRRSQGLMLLLAFLTVYSLLQGKNILHSVKTSLELDFEKATGDTDVFPTGAPYPTSPSTSGKVKMSELDHNQAETEVATIRLEQEREDASAEEDALVISGVPIEDDPRSKAQSLEMENIATSDTTTHPLARQIQTTVTTNVTATDTVHEKLERHFWPRRNTPFLSSGKS